MNTGMICLAHWSVELPDDAAPLDRDDPYYFELCYDAYADLAQREEQAA